jgi:acylphosphatase
MAEEKVARLEAVVRGRVQGVGFRDFAYGRARHLGLLGYVKNVRDDHRAVEVVAEGPREALERLIERLWEGPRSARVDRVDLQWRRATGEFADFGMRY